MFNLFTFLKNSILNLYALGGRYIQFEMICHKTFTKPQKYFVSFAMPKQIHLKFHKANIGLKSITKCAEALHL